MEGDEHDDDQKGQELARLVPEEDGDGAPASVREEAARQIEEAKESLREAGDELGAGIEGVRRDVREAKQGAQDAAKENAAQMKERLGGDENVQGLVHDASRLHAEAKEGIGAALKANPEFEEIGQAAKELFQEAREGGQELWRLRDKDHREEVDLRTTLAHSLHQASLLLSKAATINKVVDAHLKHLKRQIQRAVVAELTSTLFQIDHALTPEKEDTNPAASLANFVAPARVQYLHQRNRTLLMIAPLMVLLSVIGLALDTGKSCDIPLEDYFVVYAAVEFFVVLVRFAIFVRTQRFHIRFEKELAAVAEDVVDRDDYPKAADFPSDHLVIVIERASNVPAMDFILAGGGKSDPYVATTITKHDREWVPLDVSLPRTKIRRQALDDRCAENGMSKVHFTSVQRNVLNPVWLDAFDLGDQHTLHPDDVIRLELFDYDLSSKDDSAGTVQLTLRELTEKQRARFAVLDANGNPVMGARKVRPAEIHVAVLHVPEGWAKPKKFTGLDVKDDHTLVRFDDLIQMGEEAKELFVTATTSVPYRVMQLTTPFFAAWRMYGAVLAVQGACATCEASNLKALNLVLAIGFMVLFLYITGGVFVWVFDMVVHTVGQSFVSGKAEELDRQHMGFPIFTMLANQMLKNDSSNVAVYLRLKHQREVDALRRHRRQVRAELVEVEKELKDVKTNKRKWW